MGAKPYFTSRDLIDAVKRKIMFPLSQNTFTEKMVLDFANEEMMISQVPGVISFHEEYFVFNKYIPLVSNVSRYSIPNRAIGMRLRDVMFADQNNNLFEMARVSADDKAMFARSLSSNQALAKYYLEGNEIVLTPSILTAPTGFLNASFFLRPNQLVDNSRAAIIQNFVKTIKVSSAGIAVGDYIQITEGQNTPYPNVQLFTTVQKTLVGNSAATTTVVTTTLPHGIVSGVEFQVVISEVSGSTPNINGTFTATSTGANTFTIPVNVTVPGTGGTYALDNEYNIGSTDIQTATNLALSIQNAFDNVDANNSSTATVTLTYDDITLIVASVQVNPAGITLDNLYTYINFDQLNASTTDPVTNEVDPLYTNGCLVDFLQTNPGHRTYTYDIELINISGTVGQFLTTDIQTYASTGTGQILTFLPMTVGDYIGLQNECIIPQIPPDLHTGLAERTSARILAAIGDQQGLDRINAKIQEIDGKQGTLMSSRVEGSTQKITNRHSALHYGRRGRGRY